MKKGKREKGKGKSTAPPADRIRPIIAGLRKRYPEVECALNHSSALELLVATILSAQCTDVRVNMVTPALFQKYRSATDYAAANPEVFEQEIKSTGFFRNKTKSILGMARAVIERHGGTVPNTMDDLVKLPGVGRKTANVLLGSWFKKNEGVVVDTHVTRIARRLKLTRQSDAVKIERDLMQLVPRKDWTDFSHMVIHHGRQICDARRPKCEVCPINALCPSSAA
ncbi:MAG: endonuclease III [Gemmatimonadetes bacterium]|nr:endonuclease III [Gemmatimonadota bacterium]